MLCSFWKKTIYYDSIIFISSLNIFYIITNKKYYITLYLPVRYFFTAKHNSIYTYRTIAYTFVSYIGSVLNE